MVRRKVVPYDRTRRKKHWQLADPPRRKRSLGTALVFRRLLYLSLVLYVVFGSIGDAAMGILKGQGQCRVVAVIDGDTVTMWCGGTVFERARLTGFDTPEVFSPQCFSERWRGLRATLALKGALWSAGRIQLRPGERDRYDRVLVRMTVDGRSVGNDLIARGLARPYLGGGRRSWC